MKEDLKVKFNELIRDLQSVDMDKITKLETQLQDMVTRQKKLWIFTCYQSKLSGSTTHEISKYKVSRMA